VTIAKTTAEIDQLRAKAEDYRYELINVLDQLIAVQDQNTKLLKEYTVCYKELLELRDQRDELYGIIDTHLGPVNWERCWATIAALKAAK